MTRSQDVFDQPRPVSQDLRELTEGNIRFALSLYSALKQEKGNLFFSPYSLSSALAMTYGGARNKTAEEMADALHFTLSPDKLHPAFAELSALYDKMQEAGGVQLHTANSLWPHKEYPLLPEYLELLKTYYGSTSIPLDYAQAAEEARQIINTWVEEKTQGRIKDLIGPDDIDSLTTLVLVNAIYFKGNWASQFDPAQTANAKFTLPDGSTTQVPLMRQRGRFGYIEFEYSESDHDETKRGQILELPYVGNELSMLIILPGRPEDLPELESELKAENLEELTGWLSKEEVDVFLPKFKIDWGTFEFKPPLQDLGIREAFSADADFSGMDGTKSLSIDHILHKAFIEVNEEGTEAAAATVASMTRCISTPKTFRADHPFLFLIRDKATGNILFLGRLLDPERGEQ
ncbi:MAG: serpin family protein [Candidatus Electrothrix scaldis]|nr:MAG: serpin family protein [Candidatus Electrothrix sp. GW3-3]